MQMRSVFRVIQDINDTIWYNHWYHWYNDMKDWGNIQWHSIGLMPTSLSPFPAGWDALCIGLMSKHQRYSTSLPVPIFLFVLTFHDLMRWAMMGRRRRRTPRTAYNAFECFWHIHLAFILLCSFYCGLGAEEIKHTWNGPQGGQSRLKVSKIDVVACSRCVGINVKLSSFHRLQCFMRTPGMRTLRLANCWRSTKHNKTIQNHDTVCARRC